MVYKLKKTSQFKSSLKLAKKRGLEMSLLEDIVEKLRTDKPLEQRNHNHEVFAGKPFCQPEPCACHVTKIQTIR